MSARFSEFLLTSILIELTPGPNMAYLAALTLAEGRRVGLAAVAGVALGLGVVGVLAAFGLTQIISRVPFAYDALRYLGTGFLLYLAYEAWQGAHRDARERMGSRAAFGRALLTNLLNPKSALFYVAVLPLFLPPGLGAPLTSTLALAAIYVAVATVIHAAIVLFADALRPYLVEGPREIFVRRALALSLALVALWFFWGTRS